jgi:GTP-binding protein
LEGVWGLTSRFIDSAKVYVKAGDGGRGCVAFRREKFVPFGGPAGGDGGDGGNVIFRVDTNLNTLLDFRYRPRLEARNGRPGEGDKRSGKKGQDLIVRVPPGTVLYDAETGKIIEDLAIEGQEVVAARGGKGGRGNARFASSVDRAPRKFEEGTPGEERSLQLELKSIADVGLVGFPNAGKSTLLRAISNATPEVAPYPFTTLTPHLGVVDGNGEEFIVADIPGLIEGASEGKGLGREFLRHIERTRVLLYVVEIGVGSFQEVQTPVEDFLIVRREVLSYSDEMKQKDSIVAINKIDLAESKESLLEIKRQIEEISGKQVFLISADEKTGLNDLILGISNVLAAKKRISGKEREYKGKL